jgi:hypothetical protein
MNRPATSKFYIKLFSVFNHCPSGFRIYTTFNLMEFQLAIKISSGNKQCYFYMDKYKVDLLQKVRIKSSFSPCNKYVIIKEREEKSRHR